MPSSLCRLAARRRGVRWASAVIAITWLSGCAGNTAVCVATRESAPASRILLTAPELEKYRGANSLMEALDAMHPAWLTSAGRKPKVSIDGAAPADYTALFYVPVYAVVDVSLQRVGSVGRVMTTAAGHVVTDADLLLVRTR